MASQQCQQCNNITVDESGLCYLHREGRHGPVSKSNGKVAQSLAAISMMPASKTPKFPIPEGSEMARELEKLDGRDIEVDIHSDSDGHRVWVNDEEGRELEYQFDSAGDLDFGPDEDELYSDDGPEAYYNVHGRYPDPNQWDGPPNPSRSKDAPGLSPSSAPKAPSAPRTLKAQKAPKAPN